MRMLDTHWRFFSRVDNPRVRFGHRGVALISDPTKKRRWVSNLFRKQLVTSTDKRSMESH